MSAKEIKRAYEILDSYSGDNEHILSLQRRYKQQKYSLSEFDVSYINKNHDYKRDNVMKIIKISDIFGLDLQERFNLDFIPTVVKLYDIIGEMGMSYHCRVQFRKSVAPVLMYVKKHYFIEELHEVDYESMVVDFDKFDDMTKKVGRSLREHQKSGVKFLLSNRKCILADSMGLGKALENNEPVATEKGWVRIGDVRIGDCVYGRDGKLHNVIGVYPQGEIDVYEVEFSCGTTIKCSEDHLWVVKKISSDENDDWLVLTLRQIMDDNDEFKIPLCQPLVHAACKLPIDPYELGKRLGENCCNNDSVAKHTQNCDYEPNIIPHKYKNASISQRYDVLRGFIESYINAEKNGNEYTFKNIPRTLAQDILELSQSLGYFAKIQDIAENQTIVRISIDPLCDNDSAKSPKSQKIERITYVGKSECTCIKVDSNDETFLTRSYVVTHNTTTATVASIASEAEKVLVICPATMKTTWKKELAYYVDKDDIQIINGSKWDSERKYSIINYEVLKNFYTVPTEDVFEEKEVIDAYGNISTVFIPVMVKNRNNGRMEQKQKKTRRKDVIDDCLANSKLFKEKFDCIIIDEAQRLSNSTSNRYRIVEDFLKRAKADYVFLLTGTPLTNNPRNLYNVLRLINAPITANYDYYMERYCDGHKIKLKNGKEFMKTGNSTNLEELKDRIKHHYIRRLISDVPDMVNKTVSARYYDLDEKQCAEYENLWQQYLDAQEEEYKEDTEDYRRLVEGGLVRRYLANEMVDNTIQLVNEMLEDVDKVVVVCTFQDEVDKFRAYFKDKAVVYDGRVTSAKKKDEAIDQFTNNPKVKVFIGNINAASVGLTLTVASVMVFNSYSWSEVDNRQMQDRIWRLTQKNDCEIIYQLWTDSISADMWEKVIYKGLIMDTVIKKESAKD